MLLSHVTMRPELEAWLLSSDHKLWICWMVFQAQS